jgi:hypothetical protein
MMIMEINSDRHDSGDIEQIELDKEISRKKEEGKKEKVPETKWDHLKEEVFEFCARTDINAFTKVFEYKNPFAKLAWLVFLFGALAFTGWVMSTGVLDFLQWPVQSQIGVYFENPTEFPAVTFCDVNPFTTKESHTVYNNITTHYKSKRTKTNDTISLLENPDLYSMAAFTYSDDYKKKLGLNINHLKDNHSGTFAFCKYNNTDCVNDLHWYWDYEYGNCFQFNSGRNYSNAAVDLKQTNRPGKTSGLQISAFPILFGDQGNVNTNLYAAGFVVFVHNASLRPLKSEGVFVERGKETFISVKRTFITNAYSPYTSCQDLSSYSSFLYNFIINSPRYSTYRQQDCFNLCIQVSIINQCNCTHPAYDNPYGSNSSIKQCIDLDDYYCFDPVINGFDSTDCATNSCPLECESIEYDLSLSSLVNPSFLSWYETGMCNFYKDLCYSYIDYYGNGAEIWDTNWENYKNHFVKFNVFYKSLSYTEIDTSPATTVSTLVANLGGTMSLIVSVSAFTIAEIVEFIFLMIYASIFKKSTKVSVAK